MDKLLGRKEACEALGISRPTLYKYIAEGRLRAHLIGNAWNFREGDLEKFLDQTAAKLACILQVAK
jgi:excisionase family DNA binding protein